jgi:hypothetical protein
VWFETHERLETALVRERQIKKWKRDWKINLIERENPHWADLYPALSPESGSRNRSLPAQRPDARMPHRRSGFTTPSNGGWIMFCKSPS